ncbi:DUF2092 domain-containing protein [Sandaracinus amylolyticus]|uniref:DUF2092 domain-containing protein n=1 Tax=Sandaracinus amylolyticus TaxID=927083 RepID=UPI00146FF932|nr:DUF2092 domain-containing protein [Sandaracinus amylolyticus]
MDRANGTKLRIVAGAIAAVAAISAAAWTGDAQQRPRGEAAARGARPAVDPEADRHLRAMSQYLAGLRSFRVDADSSLEVVLESGQKLQYLASSRVSVRRPDRLRSERHGALADLTLYYDGDSITLHGRRANLFATADAPRTLDQAIDFARDELDIEAPAADLLMSDVYRTLGAEAASGTYVGTAEVGGVNCHHLAFRGRSGSDWQLWIQEGATPLPMRYVVVSTDVRSQPQFAVDLHDWQTNAAMSDAEFAFEPPPGAQRIEFRRVLEERRAQGQGAPRTR